MRFPPLSIISHVLPCNVVVAVFQEKYRAGLVNSQRQEDGNNPVDNILTSDDSTLS